MPVVEVAVASAAVDALLPAVADAVAATLDLPAGGVLAVHVPTGGTVASGGAQTAPWIVLTIHGSRRDADAMTAAVASAEDAARTWAAASRVPFGGAWASWVVRG